jgi:hypothetical protein
VEAGGKVGYNEGKFWAQPTARARSTRISAFHDRDSTVSPATARLKYTLARPSLPASVFLVSCSARVSECLEFLKRHRTYIAELAFLNPSDCLVISTFFRNVGTLALNCHSSIIFIYNFTIATC